MKVKDLLSKVLETRYTIETAYDEWNGIEKYNVDYTQPIGTDGVYVRSTLPDKVKNASVKYIDYNRTTQQIVITIEYKK